MEFKIHSKYKPMGDQPQAIEQISKSIKEGNRFQTLLGVTGSGKTFTMANIIEKVQKPTLIIAHNKTLAAQLCSEFKEFFPENAVEFFVSYYDYYQPEAYIVSSDTYIEKTSSINEEIEKLRHSATASLSERRDVIIVASVSCIYSLGDPKEYLDLGISMRPGMEKSRDEVIGRLVDIQYQRSDIDFERGTFRVRGDTVEIYPASYGEKAVRIEFFGDEIDRISEINTVTGEVLSLLSHIAIYPASHYATSRHKIDKAIMNIENDLMDRIKYFKDNDKLIEAQRIEQRTYFDIEMMREIGYCSGIENYSTYFDGRKPGQPPFTLLDYFPDDFMVMVDESHVTIPQVHAMYGGDHSRKEQLIEYGFRLPAAADNRPLMFEEFEKRVPQAVFVSATPAKYEREHSSTVAEQVIRPTGLLDPEITVLPASNQVDSVLGEINRTVEMGDRVLITTLTKKMAEHLTDYLSNMGVRVRYMHSDIDTLERMEIIRDLRLGEFDVLVGINLLREGLDLPEVSLVAIMDADKEGFLRSETSLIQTIGRAARNDHGRVIMYADAMTPSLKYAIDETARRRKIQQEYNKEHGIVPKTIIKEVRSVLEISKKAESQLSEKEIAVKISRMEDEMKQAADRLDFELATKIRDAIFALKGEGKQDKKRIRRREKLKHGK